MSFLDSTPPIFGSSPSFYSRWSFCICDILRILVWDDFSSCILAATWWVAPTVNCQMLVVLELMLIQNAKKHSDIVAGWKQTYKQVPWRFLSSRSLNDFFTLVHWSGKVDSKSFVRCITLPFCWDMKSRHLELVNVAANELLLCRGIPHKMMGKSPSWSLGALLAA